MCRKTSCFAAVAACLLFPAGLFAGGPPMLSLPIAGVTAENSGTCAEMLTAKLEKKLSSIGDAKPAVEIRHEGSQSYLVFYLQDDVALHDVEAALKGSSCTIPRDKLRFFGHVVLAVDAGTTPSEKLSKNLQADLKKLDHVSVAAVETKDNLLLVTVDMPYLVENGRSYRETVGWNTFQRNDLASDPSTKSESPITARNLPNYTAFRDLVAKHKATLTDIRWSTKYACRPVGCVTAPEADTVTSAKPSSQTSLKVK
jgi:hypothetical protein